MARDPWLDNTKFVLVTLVVVGHSLGLVLLDELNVQVYTFLYLWHMPLFIFVSGHLSRSFRWDRRHLVGVVTTLLVPYAIFEFALQTYRNQVLDQHESGPLWIDPHWGMWYLLALAIWRVATPLLARHWLVLPLSIGVSLWAGTVDMDLLALPRVFGMLPFFVLGLHTTPAMLARLRGRWVVVPALVVMAALWVRAGDPEPIGRIALLWWDRSYEALGFTAADGIGYRTHLLLLNLAGLVAALALVPRRGGVMAAMGRASLVVYLFHGFFVRTADRLDWLPWGPDHPTAAMWVTVAAAVGLSALLAAPPVSRPLTWTVDPVGSWQRHRATREQRSRASS